MSLVYEHALMSIEEAYKASMRAFIAWAKKDWIMDDKTLDECGESQDYKKGWNASIEGLDGALDIFLEEIHP